MTLEYLLDICRTTMQSAKFCTVITQGADRMNARILQPFDPEMDWTIWFGTHPDSRKIADLRRNPSLTVLYYDTQDIGYITLLGKAEVIETAELRQKYWNPNWQNYFPRGPEEGYILIKFAPDQMELLSFGHKVAPEPFGLKPAVLKRQMDTWILA
ncbi:MAG: pyridoxamine 5'-phosphate oxidase family protein [bacterium]|nr:pyridoxamine 5'-phosphate oxidase family protein [bacterium]